MENLILVTHPGGAVNLSQMYLSCNQRTRTMEYGPLAIVKETYSKNGAIVRTVRVKTSNKTLERAVQQLYSLELKCDVAEMKMVLLNPDTPRCEPRPMRDAVAATRWRI